MEDPFDLPAGCSAANGDRLFSVRRRVRDAFRRVLLPFSRFLNVSVLIANRSSLIDRYLDLFITNIGFSVNSQSLNNDNSSDRED